MTKILAVDASTEVCSVALLSADKTLERISDVPKSHADRLLPMVDELLAEAGAGLGNLDAIAFGAGPGSFTGLRICVGVVQGLAFAADLPLVSVSSLEAMAYTAAQRYQEPWIVPVLDARMKEVYWAAYRMEDGYPVPVIEPRVSPIAVAKNELCQWLAARKAQTACLGVGKGWELLEGAASELHQCDKSIWPTASAIAALGMQAFGADKRVTAAEAEPVYLRNEVNWKKRAPARRQ